MRQLLLLSLAVLLTAGCGTGDVQNDLPDTTLADLPGNHDLTGTDTADSSSHETDLPGDLPDSAPEDVRCPNGFTFIDFPCNAEFECLDQKRYSQWKTLSCAEEGYDPECCSGASCEHLKDDECASDELCVTTEWVDRCAKKDCGGDLAATCPDVQFCERPYGSCDGPGSEGVCLPRITDCGYDDGCAWPGCRWECGCDGVTYGSTCDRFNVGIAKFTDGPCCIPGKISFDQDNATASDTWETCVRTGNQDPEWLDIVRNEITSIDPTATCAAGGPTSTCSPSEIACRGALVFESGSTRITDETWGIICRIAGFPYVDSIVGRGGPQCEDTLGPVPFCITGCQDPCGCEACTFNDRRCDDTDPMLLYTCDNGCWGRIRCQVAVCKIEDGVETCQNGQVCLDLSGEASCYPDCDSLLNWWTYDPSYGYEGCTKDADCKVVNGGCQVGLPAPCWAAANINTPLDEILAAQRQWQGTGCGGTICQCDGPKPVPKCLEGGCTVPAQ